MGTTTKKALRWPTPTVGVKPNVAQDIRNLAEDLDLALTAPVSVPGSDPNTISSSGFYQGGSLANAPAGSTSTFFIHALYRDSGTQVQTAYNMGDGTRWVRGTASGTWTAWARIGNADPVDITAVDLNTISTSGNFQGSGLINAPLGSANTFFLSVIYRDSSNQVQTAHNMANGNHWWRMKQGGTWKPWAQSAENNDTGWSLTPIVPASGWGNKTDPKLNTSGTVVGGVRNLNGFVEYRFQLTRTSATAVTSSASGNIGGDPVIATVNPATYPQFVPSSIVDDAFDVIGVQAGVARIDDAGQITISALYPNDTINQNDVIQVSLRFLAG